MAFTIDAMDDDEFYNYGTPWGVGSLGPMFEMKVVPNPKRMSFIGFYENKEKKMPYMVDGHRDYKREDKWDANHPGRAEARNERHKARAMTDKAGLTHKGDGRDVDHRVPLSKGGKTTKSNLRVVSESANRSFSRNADSSLKSQTSKKEAAKKK